MGLAAILFIQRSISLTEVSAVEQNHEAYELPEAVIIYDINGPLFFGSAQKALKTVSSVRPEVQVVILDMTEVTMLDMSAMVAMESIGEDLQKRQIKLVINGLQPRMLLKLRRAGIRKQVGKVAFSRTLSDGVETAEKMLKTSHPIP